MAHDCPAILALQIPGCGRPSEPLSRSSVIVACARSFLSKAYLSILITKFHMTIFRSTGSSGIAVTAEGFSSRQFAAGSNEYRRRDAEERGRGHDDAQRLCTSRQRSFPWQLGGLPATLTARLAAHSG